MKRAFLLFLIITAVFVLFPSKAHAGQFQCGYSLGACQTCRFSPCAQCGESEVAVASDGTTCNSLTTTGPNAEPFCNNAGPFNCTNEEVQSAPKYLCNESNANCDEIYANNPRYEDADINWGSCNVSCEQNNPDSVQKYRCEGRQCIPDDNGTVRNCSYCEDGFFELGVNPAVCADGKSIKTAIGCIPFTDSPALAARLVAMGIGIGGGVTLIVIVFASFQIMTSGGEPKKLADAKALVFAALSGILLIVLSGFVLRLLGVSFLGLF